MSDQALRSKLIRLAHANPELRPQLMSLLGKTAAVSTLGNASKLRFQAAKEKMAEAILQFLQFQENIKTAFESLQKVDPLYQPLSLEVVEDLQKIYENVEDFKVKNLRLMFDTNNYLKDSSR